MQSLQMLTGNEACALGAIDAGCRFFAGYPITPSSEIAETLSLLLPKVGGTFIQMEDEIGAMGAVIGASLAGAKAMTATSGPGFSLKQENLGYACMAEVPCVVVNVQRGGPSTGMPTMPAQGDLMQARWGTHGDHSLIVLSPSGVQETYELTVRAFNLSETYRAPVILLSDEVVGHITERFGRAEPGTLSIVDRKIPNVPGEEFLPFQADERGVPSIPPFGEGYRYHVTGLTHDETGFPTNRPEKIRALLERLQRKIESNYGEYKCVDRYLMDDAEVAVIAYGSVARSAKRAVKTARERGIRAGLTRPVVIWPFPSDDIREVAGRVRRIVVPEMNAGQMAREIRCLSHGTELVQVNRVDGEMITPEDILEHLGGG
jgi:2-oxoglutarate ferredoxin oxidoreductase subunit alpha